MSEIERRTLRLEQVAELLGAGHSVQQVSRALAVLDAGGPIERAQVHLDRPDELRLTIDATLESELQAAEARAQAAEQALEEVRELLERKASEADHVASKLQREGDDFDDRAFYEDAERFTLRAEIYREVRAALAHGEQDR